MKIGRTLPPAAAPLGWADLGNGLVGMVSPARALRALEEQMREQFRVRHVFLVSSGTAALTLTLKALAASSSRTEVVIPAYTCFSVPAAVVAAGLRPVLCDIDPATFDYDRGLFQKALTGDTLCVVSHHLFGVPSDVDAVRATCAARGIFVVEDAAQAMGGEAGGRALGTVGDAGIFSLGRGKNITCGGGGVIVTRSDAIAAVLSAQLRQLAAPRPAEVLKELARLVLMAVFIHPRLYWIPAALPFLKLGQTVYPRQVPLRRLSGMKAGLLRNWRSHLARSNRLRSDTVVDFCRRLGLGAVEGPAHPFLRLPMMAATSEERRRMHARSQARGLGLSPAYPTPVNEIPELAAVFQGQRFPAAAAVAERLLTIPTHHFVSDQDKSAIADLVAARAVP